MLAVYFAVLAFAVNLVLSQSSNSCPIVTQHLSDPPYENYFYSDCITDAQAVVTSPLPDSNLSIIGPRFIVAWPAGNSGICTFFRPQDGPNGTLGIELVNSTVGSPLAVVRNEVDGSDYPFVGVQGVLAFNASAELSLAILGSVRTIRDFTEGPSLLRDNIQAAVNVTKYNDTGASFSRLWLDNVTVSRFDMVPFQNSQSSIEIDSDNKTISFGAGYYHFSTSFNYPQLEQLTPQEVLNNRSRALITQEAEQTTSLSFLSYTEKLLAGAWRFLTYFGRDSTISALLLEPVLSSGNGSAMEAVIGAVLERINRTDGSVCHEETIGDYATYANLQENITSTAAGFTYPMIDTDYFLAIIMASYFTKYPNRVEPMFAREAGSVDSYNRNLTYGQLALRNLQKVMNITAAFEANHTVQNLIHLKSSEVVGNWRDSTYGLANGRIPFDVNCALVPAALHAISTLTTIPGVFPNNTSTNYSSWGSLASRRAQVWEANTLQFFQYNISISQASERLSEFTSTSTFYDGPSHNNSLSNYSDSNNMITSYALSLNGTTNTTSIASQKIPVLHTDTGFHLFLLNSTNDTLLTPFINSTAHEILRPFPAGLTTPSGMVVANPALSGDPTLIANFTNSAYHGTVIWSWQLALMARGLERQLARCNNTTTSSESSAKAPGFCTDQSVYRTVRAAYNTLWDNIEDNSAQLESEVWSWRYSNSSGNSGQSRDGFTTVPLGALPPPPGVSGGTESNVRQLWSLTFLAVKRDEKLK